MAADETVPFSTVAPGDFFKRVTGDPGATLLRTEGGMLHGVDPQNSIKLNGNAYQIPDTEQVLRFPFAKVNLGAD